MTKLKKSVSILLTIIMVAALFTGLSAADVFAASYNLAVGDKVVTDSNYNDIFGDGSAKYNPSTHTLTLNNPNKHIKRAYGAEYGAIHLNDPSVHYTIKGTYHMTGSLSVAGVYCVGTLTLDGNFTFYGMDYGVAVNDQITIKSGSVKAVATDAYTGSNHSIGMCCSTLNEGVTKSKINVNSGVTRIEARGDGASIQADIFNAPGYKATSPEGAYFEDNEDVATFLLEDLSNKAKHVIIEPYSGTDYNVWVGARQVTSVNKDDILGDGGKAKYDPSTKTLTLNDPEIKNYHKVFSYTPTFLIYSEDNITIKGSYHMADPDPLPTRCVVCEGALTLDGSFTFKGTMHAIATSGDITVSSGTLYAESTDNIAIGSTNGKISVKNDVIKLEADAHEHYPLYAETISIGNKEVITTPTNNAIGKDSNNRDLVLNTAEGNSYATHVVIEQGEVESYYLYLASTTVTSRNCTDIFGDGTARFDPLTNTLTLNEPTINGLAVAGSSAKIMSSVQNLTIKGSYHMTEAEGDTGLMVTKGVNFDGDFTFMGKQAGVYSAGGDITVSSGNFKAVGGSEGYAGMIAIEDNIYFKTGLTKADLQGSTYPLLAKNITLGARLKISTPENPALVYLQNSELYTIAKNDTTIVTRTVIEPAAEKYDVYLGDVQVDEDNKDNILGDGTASYDPSTNTLTLSEPTINGEHTVSSNTYKIFSYYPITVKGSYHMTGMETAIGMGCGNKLTLDGDFNFEGNIYGVYSGGDIDIISGTVTAKGGSDGYAALGAMGTLTISNNIDKLDLTGELVSLLAKSISIGDEIVVTTPENYTTKTVTGQFYSICTQNGSYSKRAVLTHRDNLATDPETVPLTNPTETTAPPTDTTAPPTETTEPPTETTEPPTETTEPPTETTQPTETTNPSYEEYELWVSGIHVTSENKDDILNDGGKAKYDPDTKTLTLDNPSITGSYSDANIYAHTVDLNIKGTWHKTEADTDCCIEGYYTHINLYGDFTLKGNTFGILTDYNLSIHSGTTKCESNIGILVGGTLNVYNDAKSFEAVGSNCAAQINFNEIVKDTEVVVLEPRNYSFRYHCVYDNDAQSYAKRLVVESLILNLDGEGTKSNPYLIKTADDWDVLADYIAKGKDTSSKYFRLENDIEVSTMLGNNSSNAFKGIFDGNGKTLTLNLEADGQYTAPFSAIENATIKNLTTDGTVKGGWHCSGLVGAVNDGTNLIENCVVKASITSISDSNKRFAGGFVGHGGDKGATTIKYCVFDGELNNLTHGGVFWGWGDYGSTPTVENCLDVSDSEHPAGIGEPQLSSLKSVYYTADEKIDGRDRAWYDKGKHPYTITSDCEFKLSGDTGIEYDNKIYAAEGETVKLTAVDPYALYVSDECHIDQKNKTVSLIMPAKDVVIYKSDVSDSHSYTEINSDYGNNNEKSENLFDRDTDTKWCVSHFSSSFSVTFQTTKPVNPCGYVFVTANDSDTYPGRAPKSWTLEGSKDGSNWDTISDVSNFKDMTKTNCVENYFSANPTENTYTYFRFTVHEVNSKDTFQLSELRLIGEEIVDYPLWVGNVQVTSKNKDDILGDGGKVKFDPDTSTLTLDDPDIPETTNYSSGIYAKRLSINIKGKWHVTQPYTFAAVYGFYSHLTFDGDFKLTSNRSAIYTDYNLIINSGTMEITGDARIEVGGLVSIHEDVERFEIDSKYTAAYVGYETIEYPDIFKTYSPENLSFVNHYSYDTDADTFTNHILIQKLPTYDVSFETGGHGDAVDKQAVYENHKASAPTDPTAEGYTFGGWYTDEKLENAYDFDTAVTADTTLYAKWTINEYNVTFEMNEHGTQVDSQKVNYNEKASEPEAPEAEGYTFGGWFTDDKLETAYDFDTAVTADITLYAKWTLNKYDIDFNMNGHGVQVDTQTVAHGDKALKPAAPGEKGYTFGGWYTDEKLKNLYSFDDVVTKSLTLYAKWTINNYTVSFNSNGGSGEIESVKVKYNGEFTLPDCTFTAPDGKEFDCWDKGTPGEKITITDDTVIKAVWKDIPTEPATTEPTTEATEPTTEATEPTTAEPTTEATEPTTAEPATEATEPATKATEPATEATEPATEATQPATQAPTNAPSSNSKAAVSKKITNLKNDKDPKESKFGLLSAHESKVKKNSITVKWNKVKGAKTYAIYGNKCGKPYKLIKLVSKTSFTQKKLKKGSYYKYLIVAFDKNDQMITMSKTLHISTKGGITGNYKKITTAAKKDKVKLKKGKTFKLKAKAVAQNKVLKVRNHRKLCYESSNTKIAKVSKTGKITARKKGKCFVYVYAQSGTFKKIKVTVK